ncbi:MAG TPA: histidine kinase [Candidatus Paceibacterota bacterium]
MNQLKGNITNKLSTYNSIVNSLLTDEPFMNYLTTDYQEDYESYTDYLAKVMPLIKRVNDNDGEVKIKIFSNNKTIGVSGVTNNLVEDLKIAEWFNPNVLSNNVIWMRPNMVAGTRVNYLGLYKVIKSDYLASKINSVIAVFFKEAQLYSLISEEGKGGKVIFLIDDTGCVLTSTEKDKVNKNIMEIPIEGINKKDITIQNGTVVNYRSGKYIFLSTKLNDKDLVINGWNLIYMIPTNKIYSDIREIWISSLVLCCICLIITLVAIYFISENISGRILNLIKEIKKVWAGNFKVAVEVCGIDEIGELEKDFNDMISKIDTLINEVYETNLKVKDAQINNQKILMEKKQAEIISLQGQINPHYLFNTLESIRMNLILKEDRETANIVRIFADSFRSCIDNSEDIYTLKEEIIFIQNYFTVQKYRYGDKIDLIIDIPEEFLNCLIPKFIIQPIVENAVYHGIEMKVDNGKIKIEATEINGNLYIYVNDDGI